ncbi:putative hyaluronan/mRNA-binding protein [Septoria linicola]|nr:putative hyaluronan/mRNA-binding protein [Septoria linicola]
MSDAIVSKNLYELLGNDPELDPERATPPVPTKVVDKPVARSGKRNGPAEGAAARDGAPRQGGRGGAVRGDQGASRVEQQNRDDGLRSDRHSRPVRDYERRGGEGRGRGDRRGRGGYAGRGRGEGRGGPRDDRHSHTGLGDHEKQAAHGWGGNDGPSELADETAGDAIAKAEANNEAGFTPDTAGADPAFSNGPDGVVGEDAAGEPEDKTKSYDEYLKELAEKKLALSGEAPSIRKANEGSKTKFPEGQAVSREQEDFFIGGGGKTKKTKEIKEKERINLDGQYYAAPDAGDRGGRGGRGGRGRGEGRGSFRGEGRGRGGGRGRGDRGDFRGAPRGDRAPRGGAGFNANDSSAFPALGA